MVGYLPFGRETPGDGEEGVESPLRASLPALQNLLTAVPNPVLAANRTEEIFASRDAGFLGQQCHLMAKRSYDRLLATDLNCFSLHMNWMSASSSGSLHFSSSVEQSTTSGSRNKPLASLYSQSSGEGCFCTTTTRAKRGKDSEPDRDLHRPPQRRDPQLQSTYAQVDVVEDFLNGAVLPDEVDGPFGADPLDGAAVVAAEQNAKVYELIEQKGSECIHIYIRQTEKRIVEAGLPEETLYLFVCEADVLQHPTQVEFLNWKFPLKKKKYRFKINT